MPKAKKFKKQKINSEPLWTTVLGLEFVKVFSKFGIFGEHERP